MLTATQFRKHAKVTRNDQWVNKSYRSLCGDWEIVEVRWLNSAAYGHYWLAIKHFGDRKVSQHKSRRAAEAACD